MPHTVGNSLVQKSYVGSTPVSKVYVGSNEIWSQVPDPIVRLQFTETSYAIGATVLDTAPASPMINFTVNSGVLPTEVIGVGNITGRAANFATSTWLTFDDAANTYLNFGDGRPFSIGGWFYTPTSTNTGLFEYGAVNTSYSLGGDSSNQLFFRAMEGASTTHDIDFNPVISAWNFIIATYDGSLNRKLYLNNNAALSDALHDIPEPATKIMHIGTLNTTGYSFAGKMADFRIWDSELSADQVSVLYQAEKA